MCKVKKTEKTKCEKREWQSEWERYRQRDRDRVIIETMKKINLLKRDYTDKENLG